MQFKIILVLLVLVVVTGCEGNKKNDQIVENFVFSYSAMYSDYSMKFTKNDTVFLEKRFPKPTEHFYFIIKESEKQKILKLAEDINFDKYDTIYDQYLVNRLVDGTSYKFYVEKGSKKDWVYIYGKNGPKEFYVLSDLLNSLKEKQNLRKTSKVINFGNLDFILLPEPPESQNN